MFKEPESGAKDINIERIEEYRCTASSCRYSMSFICMTMLKDGMKAKEKEAEIEVWTLQKSLPEQIDCKLH
ncbi:hypothetical protein GCM10009120_32260 [Sphingobacterium siyangense subsp. cladoniae]|jgi:hypothetical protein|nr:hypothetical protein [Sphingobacterium siyangense]